MFGRYLAREHGFAHYDLECHPRGWPRPELKAVWDSSPRAFIIQARQHHARIALDWGFPVECLPIVKELQAEGARLIWFNGDRARARKVFVQRGGIALACFDLQVKALQEADYPRLLDCTAVETLSGDGIFLEPSEIARMLFP